MIPFSAYGAYSIFLNIFYNFLGLPHNTHRKSAVSHRLVNLARVAILRNYNFFGRLEPSTIINSKSSQYIYVKSYIWQLNSGSLYTNKSWYEVDLEVNEYY